MSFKKRSLRVFSRHPSHAVLRRANLFFPFFACIRLGSTNPGQLPYKVQINTPEAVKNSADKLLMKQKFTEAAVPTADWWTIYRDEADIYYFEPAGKMDKENVKTFETLPYPIISKHRFGSRGTGNVFHENLESLKAWLEAHKNRLDSYIFERYYSYNREYRLHVTEQGCFYTCRKALKAGAEARWYRNDSNSVWLLETNPGFDKPVNWDKIVAACVSGLKAVGLDVAAFDVRVQSRLDNKGNERPDPQFIVLESNSAPSLGSVTTEKYILEIPKIVEHKLNK